ncbi:MAG: hypothetical protein WC971_07400 [Coriobacteriia bacterium]
MSRTHVRIAIVTLALFVGFVGVTAPACATPRCAKAMAPVMSPETCGVDGGYSLSAACNDMRPVSTGVAAVTHSTTHSHATAVAVFHPEDTLAFAAQATSRQVVGPPPQPLLDTSRLRI